MAVRAVTSIWALAGRGRLGDANAELEHAGTGAVTAGRRLLLHFCACRAALTPSISAWQYFSSRSANAGETWRAVPRCDGRPPRQDDMVPAWAPSSGSAFAVGAEDETPHRAFYSLRAGGENRRSLGRENEGFSGARRRCRLAGFAAGGWRRGGKTSLSAACLSASACHRSSATAPLTSLARRHAAGFEQARMERGHLASLAFRLRRLAWLNVRQCAHGTTLFRTTLFIHRAGAALSQHFA